LGRVDVDIGLPRCSGNRPMSPQRERARILCVDDEAEVLRGSRCIWADATRC